MRSVEERHLSASRNGMADVHTALAWAVQTLDRDFTDASMVKIHVEQVATSPAAPEGQWEYRWTAAVSGLISEIDRTGS